VSLRIALTLAVSLCGCAGVGAEPTFEKDVLPILNAHCLQCHGGIHQKSGLDLRTATATLKEVPFVEVYLGDWDSHEKRRADLVRETLLPQSDQGISALLTGLKERGLLDSTLVVWMGEFGRTPKTGEAGSRQHFDKAWSTVLFGGGVPGGLVVGKTDEKGNEVTEKPVSGPEFIATVLNVLGLDPASDLHAGSRPVRMVAPGGTPIKEVIKS